MPTPKRESQDQFLKTFDSITRFTILMNKIKKGSRADANIELSRDECLDLVWGLGILSDRQRRRGQ